MSRFPSLVCTGILLTGLLSGCNFPAPGDTAAISTSAALTVEAKLTAAAPAATATLTPAPFPSLPPATAIIPSATSAPLPTATSSCDKAQFVTETVPDDSVFSGGDAFVKTWNLKNIGTCSWTPAYALKFTSGDSMSGPAVVALGGNVDPGQTATLSVNLKAPSADGTYRGNWGLRNGAGVVFSSFWVQIKVSSGGGGAFAVTSVTYSFSTVDNGGNLGCPNVTAHITTNASGDVQYHFTRSDGAMAPVQTLHFGSAGSQDVSEAWYLPTAAGTQTRWIGIYIDSPNHQDFGHKEFTSTCTSP